MSTQNRGLEACKSKNVCKTAITLHGAYAGRMNNRYCTSNVKEGQRRRLGVPMTSPRLASHALDAHEIVAKAPLAAAPAAHILRERAELIADEHVRTRYCPKVQLHEQ